MAKVGGFVQTLISMKGIAANSIGEITEIDFFKYRIKVGSQIMWTEDAYVEYLGDDRTQAIVNLTEQKLKLEADSREWDAVVIYRNTEGENICWESWQFGQKTAKLFGSLKNRSECSFIRMLAEETQIPIVLVDGFELLRDNVKINLFLYRNGSAYRAYTMEGTTREQGFIRGVNSLARFI